MADLETLLPLLFFLFFPLLLLLPLSFPFPFPALFSPRLPLPLSSPIAVPVTVTIPIPLVTMRQCRVPPAPSPALGRPARAAGGQRGLDGRERRGVSVAVAVGVLQDRARRPGFLVARLVRVLGLGGRVALAVVVRVGGAMARGGHGAWEGRGAGRLRGVRLVVRAVVLGRRWVGRVVGDMGVRMGMMVRMIRNVRAAACAESSGAGRKGLDLSTRDDA